MPRELSKAEEKKLRAYGLSSLVEKKIRSVWQLEEKIPVFFDFFRIIIEFSFWGGAVILWLNYFISYPENSKIIISWLTISYVVKAADILVYPFLALVSITWFWNYVWLMSIRKEKRDSFKRYALDIWYKRKSLLSMIWSLGKILFFLGFCVNEFFPTAIFTFIFFFGNFYAGSRIYDLVQAEIDEIVISDDGFIMNAGEVL